MTENNHDRRLRLLSLACDLNRVAPANVSMGLSIGHGNELDAHYMGSYAEAVNLADHYSLRNTSGVAHESGTQIAVHHKWTKENLMTLTWVTFYPGRRADPTPAP